MISNQEDECMLEVKIQIPVIKGQYIYPILQMESV